MRAFSTANGGVMFVPDEIERIEKPVSYNELVRGEPKTRKPSFIDYLLGRSKKAEKKLREAA
ncbi:MAG TPA: hypothetical protein PKX38_07905 [Alphaproteobacteria bacterium]|nr:hypothetical protein [Micavibrio sp.]MBK9563499.1 hypothetical protein [Micavibrio sp.]HQX27845.1 hypothetical protein [Alphaproteobacteria bacterium]